MDISELMGKVDHTQLGVAAKWEDIQKTCDEGICFGAVSVCIPPCYVQRAAEYAAGKIKICTVVGFPNGYATTQVKVFEAADAVENGADEIDMVANIGWIKAGRFDLAADEIAAVKKACQGRILKVIVETCLLSEEEKAAMCQTVVKGGADFIKTSTGFSTGGATPEDIKLFKENLPPGFGIKAAGGIASIEDGETFLKLGATRLGTSRIIKLLQNQDAGGY